MSTITIIRMPSLSPTMTTGKLKNWIKKLNDIVMIGDVLCEVETDKAVMEMESPANGVIRKIVVEASDNQVSVESAIALLAENDVSNEEIELFYQEHVLGNSIAKHDTVDLNRVGGFNREIDKKHIEQNIEQNTLNKSDNRHVVSDSDNNLIQINTLVQQRVRISPYAKMIAQEKKVDYTKIIGTGKMGFITEKDVMEFYNSSKQIDQSTYAVESNNDTRVVDNQVIHVINNKINEIVLLSNMRKAISAKTSHAMRLVPHFYVNYKINMSKILEAKSRLNIKTTINDWIVLACGRVLQRHQQINAVWVEDNHSLKQFVASDINCAMDVGFGPMLPVVKSVERMRLQEIHMYVKDIATKVTERKSVDFDIGGFSISNLGMYGVHSFNAVINYPQVAMLAVGGIDEQQQCMMTLACDHRALDGKDASVFLRDLKDVLSDPIMLIV